jgi:hypothetical protein
MIQTAAAAFDEYGAVRLLEPVGVAGVRRALVGRRLEPPTGGCCVVAPSTESIVLIPFLFSDLSQVKLRRAVVLASGHRND